MNKELSFAVFCLESYKTYRHISGKTAAQLFNDYSVFDYLFEFYDVLHTTGSSYINHDIDAYLRVRGAKIPA